MLSKDPGLIRHLPDMSLQELYDLIEVIAVDNFNQRVAIEIAREEADRGG